MKLLQHDTFSDSDFSVFLFATLVKQVVALSGLGDREGKIESVTSREMSPLDIKLQFNFYQ